jgi:branched-chain amino acid aminotransferase
MAQNRAYVYGDLLFETLKIVDGRPLHAAYHADRVAQSSQMLGFNLPDAWCEDYFSDLVFAHAAPGNTRGRLVISRLSEGYYLPSSNEVAFSFESWPLPEPKLSIDKIDVYDEQYKACTSLSNIKSGNALIYVLASKFAATNNLNDVLLLNEHGRIAEATSSNLFIIKKDNAYTPPLSEGPVNGVMRKVLLDNATKLGINMQETPLEIKDLFEADECFLTNVIGGITSVHHFRNKVFKTTVTAILQKAYNL